MAAYSGILGKRVLKFFFYFFFLLKPKTQNPWIGPGPKMVIILIEEEVLVMLMKGVENLVDSRPTSCDNRAMEVIA